MECTDAVHGSIIVTIKRYGDVISTEIVPTFTVNGGPEQECEPIGGGRARCGAGLSGTVVLDFGTQTRTVQVRPDDCPIPVEVDFDTPI